MRKRSPDEAKRENEDEMERTDDGHDHERHQPPVHGAQRQQRRLHRRHGDVEQRDWRSFEALNGARQRRERRLAALSLARSLASAEVRE